MSCINDDTVALQAELELAWQGSAHWMKRALAAEAEIADLRAECDKVGIPYDAAGLVRHHRANAGLAAAVDTSTERFKRLQAEAALAKLQPVEVKAEFRVGRPDFSFEVHTVTKRRLVGDWKVEETVKVFNEGGTS